MITIVRLFGTSVHLLYFFNPCVCQRATSLLLCLGAMSNVVLNMWSRYLFEIIISFLLGIIPQLDLLNHIVVLFFEELPHCFP